MRAADLPKRMFQPAYQVHAMRQTSAQQQACTSNSSLASPGPVSGTNRLRAHDPPRPRGKRETRETLTAPAPSSKLLPFHTPGSSPCTITERPGFGQRSALWKARLHTSAAVEGQFPLVPLRLHRSRCLSPREHLCRQPPRQLWRQKIPPKRPRGRPPRLLL